LVDARRLAASAPRRIGGTSGRHRLSRTIFRRAISLARLMRFSQKLSIVEDMRRLPRVYGDAVLAVVVAVVYVAEVSFEADVHRREPAALVALGFAASLLVRRRYPLLPLLAGLAVIELDNTAIKGLAEAGMFLVGFIVALYSAGRWARGRTLAVCGVVAAVAIPLAAIEPGQPVGFGDIAFFLVFFGAPIVAGRVFRHRAERERVLVDEHETRTAAAITDERARIARELHDVVAHAISVIVLQARGGRRMLAEDPGETRAALDAIEHAGEQALAEMRRLLGMLRDADERAALAPQPSLARLDELAAEVGAAGLPVEVRVVGDVVELPPSIDVSAYRIVQEALTNALKHAGPARAHVCVRYGPHALELEVVDDGTGNGNGSGSGHGLVGLRERVGVYGGELEAGAQPDGGFRVRATLPLAER
jgi:signal transduction histidine kinase